MQRIEGFRAVELPPGDVALTERGHPQVNEGMRQVGAAQPACLPQ